MYSLHKNIRALNNESFLLNTGEAITYFNQQNYFNLTNNEYKYVSDINKKYNLLTLHICFTKISVNNQPKFLKLLYFLSNVGKHKGSKNRIMTTHYFKPISFIEIQQIQVLTQTACNNRNNNNYYYVLITIH